MSLTFGPRRGVYIDISQELRSSQAPLSGDEVVAFETLDLVYRSLCALMYNYVPMSGHPGGSISSGRFVAGLLYDAMDYDMADPDRVDADIISYAAGHKALGLYAMWALRNEVARAGAPGLLPNSEALQLRLEDLLGFRRNPTSTSPLIKKFHAKPLDGHPTPATPFVRLSTGASGVGVPASLGLAFGAMDTYGRDAAPAVHIVEGEGGMTPGRVSEAMAAAGTASLENAIMHVDWNQASIDSNHVCRDGERPGDYVQWTPMELAYLHDWNVIYVPDGRDFQQVIAAQRRAAALDNGQPTAVVYHTTKGWKYGIEGRASHGAGHKLCTEPFYQAVEPLLEFTERELPRCDDDCQRCAGGASDDVIEDCYWQALEVVRDAVAHNKAMVAAMAARLTAARDRLDEKGRAPRDGAPDAEKIFVAAADAADTPAELALTPGKSTTLRAELGRVLGHYNQISGGAVFAASADLLDSTSVSKATAGFPEGFYNAVTHSESRTLSIGGICEDAMIAVCSGLAAYGRHAPAGSSYGAFIAPLGHIAARLHAIGNQSRQAISPGEPYRPFFLVCAHAGVKTGEDGPTHADPQALQLLQENFPASTVVTLTPWDPQEMFPLVSAALARRPAVIAPFVTRPNETVIDREALGLAPAAAARTGVYALRQSSAAQGDGTVVLQGSEVAYAFVQDALPLLEKEGVDLNVYYVASAELFDMLPAAERARIFPAERAGEAMGITGFTLATMYRWVTSERGRALSLYPFRNGHFLGSGKAHKVLEEAGIDGAGQFRAIMRYVQENR